MKKKRIPIVAAFLSFIAPGSGQLYNGFFSKGILFVCLYFVLPVFLFRLGLHNKLSGFLTVIVFLVCFWIFVIADAFFGARKRTDYILKPYNKVLIYILIFLLINGTLLIPTKIMTEKILGFGVYKILTGSMKPALSINDCLISDLTNVKNDDLIRGDFVIFLYPKDPTKEFLKRIIALEGEKIEIRDKQVYINDEPITEDYKVHNDERIFTRNENYQYENYIRDNYGPEIVPVGHCFVLGDNRDNSSDSRFWGFLPVSNIKGKPLFIYWAREKNRIGKLIK